MNNKQIEILNEEDPYTRVGKSLILDGSLRLQTRMVLIMMLSVPPNWDFSIRGMAKIANVTKDTMAKMLSELEAAGYVKRKDQARQGGHFAKAGYLVSGRPIFAKNSEPQKPDRETGPTVHKNQDTAAPCPNSSYTNPSYTKNSPQLNNKQLTTKQLSTPCSPPEGDAPAPGESRPKSTRPEKSMPVHDPEAFEKLWEIYPRKDSRKATIRAWDKLKPDRALCRVMYIAIKRQRRSDQWNEEGGKYIPLFSTWLNGRRWENEGVDLSLLNRPRKPKEPIGGWLPDPEAPS